MKALNRHSENSAFLCLNHRVTTITTIILIINQMNNSDSPIKSLSHNINIFIQYNRLCNRVCSSHGNKKKKRKEERQNILTYA